VKSSLRSTEFWFAVFGTALGTALLFMSRDGAGAILVVGSSFGYAVSRGATKHGYGKALNKPNVTRL
jgi:hypothetical protein